MATELELPRIASFIALPETSLQTLLNNPTADLIQTVLSKVAARALELEELQSDKVRLEVELENAVRTGESRARQLKGLVDKSLKDVSQLRQQLQAEESSKNALESELASIRSSSSISDAEVSQLRTRIASLESSNRDTVALLESKSTAYNALGAELAAKHQKTVELRRDVANLEQNVQSAHSAVSSAKFKEQSLQQEIESLGRTNEWLDTELKAKSAEHTKFRREKSSRITELQQQNEDAAGQIDTLQRSEAALRARVNELSQTVEERVTELQSLREEAEGKEEHFRKELETANHLNTLLNGSLQTERRRNQEISSQLDDTKENAADEVGRLGAEIETEHQERQAAERRVSELEVQVERLRSDLALLSSNANAPGTPNPRFGRSINGPAGSPAGSRFGSPAPSALKGSLSYTQLVSDYHAAKAELDAEKRRNEQLTSTIDDMMRDMEDNKPAIEEMQAEHDRLQAHIVQMSGDLDNAAKERDQAKDDAERQEGEVGALAKEGELLRKQLRDLSAQIRVLLLEVNTQKQGQGGFTQEERSRLEALARGQTAFENMEGVSQTDRIISQELTTFHNIEELQAQNEQLMRAVRELSATVESQEYREAGVRVADAQKEIAELKKELEQSQEKMNSMVTMSNSYMQERDMFRRMVLNRSQVGPGSRAESVLAESTNSFQAPVTPARNGIVPMLEGSPSGSELANYGKLLKDLQSHFDDYKAEAAQDRSMLKKEKDDLSRKTGKLRNDLSKKTSEATLAVERYSTLQGNFALVQNENAELQKWSRELSEQAAKQEIRSQQVTEDLVETKGLLESMRNETANLKAEKDFWRSVEKRLTDDNGALVSERDRLNALNASLQTILNDREHDDSETRRRLQSQVETLEADLQAARRKLNEESEEDKRVSMRREYESQRNQQRIDDLVTRLGSVREELVEAKTSRDHLQAKVDELTIELRSAQEHVELLQPRPSATNGEANAEVGAESGQTREQALALEVSELKKDLDLARNELANARTEAEQYQAISRDTEAELASLNETQEQYRKEMDEHLEERNATISSLEKKVEELQTEITTLNGDLSEKIRQQADFDRKFEEQRASLDAEVSRLKSDLERTEAAAHFHQEDLRAQAQIAQQAQKNYEDELVKHADAAKALSAARAETQTLKLEVVELRGNSQAAQAKLTQSEESWNETKERYDNELREINSRRDDLFGQNKILHQQLETLSKQLGELKKHRASADDSGAAPVAGEDNWQELIKYVRREKEIVEVQFELSSQEAKRLRQQLDHTQSQLEETRLKLVQQRRAEENSERSALNHKKLMDTINELNLNRESNATLRLEKNELRQSLSDKEKAVNELQAQIQPLNAKLQELEDLQETQNEELRMTREARERFEQRYLDVLHKSNTIDPAEFDGLKEKITEIETERNELTAKRDELQEQVDTIPAQIQAKVDEEKERYQENRAKLVEQSKKRDRDQSAKIRERDASLQAANAAKTELEAQLNSAREDLQSAKAEKDQAQGALADLQSKTNEDVQMTEDQPGEQPSGPSSEVQALQSQLEAANNEAENAGARVMDLQGKVAAAEARVQALESQLVSQQQQTTEANTRASALETQLQEASSIQAAKPATEAEPGELEEPETVAALLESLRKLEHEADELKARLLAFEQAEHVQVNGRSMPEIIAEQVEGVRAELTARHDERVRQAEDLFTKRTETMKNGLNKRLASMRQESGADAMDRLRQEHAAEIEALKSRHAEELQKLQELAKQGAAAKADGAADQKPTAGAQSTTGLPELTEAQVKELLSKNDLARRIMVNNIQNKIGERLKQAEQKADTDLKQAVIMEGKKSILKISMAENRAKAVQAKVEIVQKAAEETPEKPVGEVWNIAKEAKPVKTPAPAAAPAPTTASPSSAPTQSPQASTATSASSPPTNPFASARVAQGALASGTAVSEAKTSPAPSAGPNPAAQLRDAKPLSSPNTNAGKSGLGQSTFAPPTNAPIEPPGPSGLPQPANRAASGSGPARGGASALPVPGAPRGRGQAPSLRGGASNVGRGRGGRTGIPGRGGGQAGGGAPSGQPATGGAISASAQPFVPSKRTAADSGLDGSVHAENKRVRGGGFSG